MVKSKTPDPTLAKSRKEAVAISSTGHHTIIIGDETKDEWIATQTMRAIDLEELT